MVTRTYMYVSRLLWLKHCGTCDTEPSALATRIGSSYDTYHSINITSETSSVLFQPHQHAFGPRLSALLILPLSLQKLQHIPTTCQKYFDIPARCTLQLANTPHLLRLHDGPTKIGGDPRIGGRGHWRRTNEVGERGESRCWLW